MTEGGPLPYPTPLGLGAGDLDAAPGQREHCAGHNIVSVKHAAVRHYASRNGGDGVSVCERVGDDALVHKILHKQ